MRGNTGGDKVDALRKRASEIKAALEAVQAKQRQQEKADDRRIKALIGEAMVADSFYNVRHHLGDLDVQVLKRCQKEDAVQEPCQHLNAISKSRKAGYRNYSSRHTKK